MYKVFKKLYTAQKNALDFFLKLVEAENAKFLVHFKQKRACSSEAKIRITEGLSKFFARSDHQYGPPCKFMCAKFKNFVFIGDK
jgi:hypothetical protein